MWEEQSNAASCASSNTSTLQALYALTPTNGTNGDTGHSTSGSVIGVGIPNALTSNSNLNGSTNDGGGCTNDGGAAAVTPTDNVGSLTNDGTTANGFTITDGVSGVGILAAEGPEYYCINTINENEDCRAQEYQRTTETLQSRNIPSGSSNVISAPSSPLFSPNSPGSISANSTVVFQNGNNSMSHDDVNSQSIISNTYRGLLTDSEKRLLKIKISGLSSTDKKKRRQLQNRMAAQRSRIYKRQHLDSMYYIIGKLLSCIIRANLPEADDMVQLARRIGIQYETHINDNSSDTYSTAENEDGGSSVVDGATSVVDGGTSAGAPNATAVATAVATASSACPDTVANDTDTTATTNVPSYTSKNVAIRIISNGETTVVKKRSPQELYPNDLKELATFDCFDTIRNTQRCLNRLTLTPIVSDSEAPSDNSKSTCINFDSSDR
uniref:Ocs element-binding factor 1 n=1 Tax=Lygus hesperus TaxID=30085 RepID=A0A0A9XI67_LYGHE